MDREAAGEDLNSNSNDLYIQFRHWPQLFAYLKTIVPERDYKEYSSAWTKQGIENWTSLVSLFSICFIFCNRAILWSLINWKIYSRILYSIIMSKWEVYSFVVSLMVKSVVPIYQTGTINYFQPFKLLEDEIPCFNWEVNKYNQTLIEFISHNLAILIFNVIQSHRVTQTVQLMRSGQMLTIRIVICWPKKSSFAFRLFFFFSFYECLN